MNHKRGKPKNARAGCLMCKRQKVNGFGHKKNPIEGLGKVGGGNLKQEYFANIDIKENQNEN